MSQAEDELEDSAAPLVEHLAELEFDPIDNKERKEE